MFRLIVLLIGLGVTAAVAAQNGRGRDRLPNQLFQATLAVAGSACGFLAAQTAFRMGRLSRNREALQPKPPPGSCLVEAWRWGTGSAAFLVKAALGIGFWAAMYQLFREGFR